MKKQETIEPILVAKNLSRNFGTGQREVAAVKDIDLEVFPGELLSIIGRSGSGKTTLLNMLGGLDQPTNGSVFYKSQSVYSMTEAQLTELRRHEISFIFQSFGLLLVLSAYENVELPLRINGIPRSERTLRVQEALEIVGLGARAKHRPYELSGGEQQRVAVARALAAKPTLILADEPTGELDSATGMEIIKVLRDIAHNNGITVIVATHDLTLARMSDRIKEMVDGAFLENTIPA
jgi:putative ABC transport system ATP-binding protein